jgi:hypothetical protein
MPISRLRRLGVIWSASAPRSPSEGEIADQGLALPRREFNEAIELAGRENAWPRGDVTKLCGDVSSVRGDGSKVVGDATGLTGDATPYSGRIEVRALVVLDEECIATGWAVGSDVATDCACDTDDRSI